MANAPRFGLGMNSDHTLEEVGQQFSVTRERIRQIEAKALRKLKHPSRSKVLRSDSWLCMDAPGQRGGGPAVPVGRVRGQPAAGADLVPDGAEAQLLTVAA